MIVVRWYYRPNEIPDGVYALLMQDRYTENSEYHFWVQMQMNNEIKRHFEVFHSKKVI